MVQKYGFGCLRECYILFSSPSFFSLHIFCAWLRKLLTQFVHWRAHALNKTITFYDMLRCDSWLDLESKFKFWPIQCCLIFCRMNWTSWSQKWCPLLLFGWMLETELTLLLSAFTAGFSPFHTHFLVVNFFWGFFFSFLSKYLFMCHLFWNRSTVNVISFNKQNIMVATMVGFYMDDHYIFR